MKKLIIATLLASSFSTFAATVKITSFYFVKSGHPLAELCGKVEASEAPQNFIRVLVDPMSSRAAIYNTVAGKDGKFCLSLITYHGEARASLFEGETEVKALIK